MRQRPQREYSGEEGGDILLCWLWPWACGAAAAGTKVAIIHGELHVTSLILYGQHQDRRGSQEQGSLFGQPQPSEPSAACRFSAEREIPLAGKMWGVLIK